MGTFRTFDHTADVGLEVRGESLEDLLATAAQAVFSLIIEAGPSAVETEAEVLAEAETGARAEWEDVFVVWLQELLYRFEMEHLVPLEFDFAEAGPARVRARVGFGRFDPKRHRAATEVKAVTYHELAVREEPGGTWSARFILDV
ncbi:MAG TPA: archease [Phycisphaerae bacterium]|nr:archease [Phycisphaerae bacterium]